jgi:SAM-dependent methyltransferase
VSRWDVIWEERQAPPPQESTLARLLAGGGMDSGFAHMNEDAWLDFVMGIARRLELQEGDTVFEVGCGAGAFLLELDRQRITVGGIDRSPALIALASEVMPSGNFSVATADALDTTEPADVVLAMGVFLYFSSLGYAEEVLDRMVSKARRAVAILDLPDAATKEQAIAERERQAGGAEAYAKRYSGLDHLYYDRDWIGDALTGRGLIDVKVADQEIRGYGNSAFRFNAWGFLPKNG